MVQVCIGICEQIKAKVLQSNLNYKVGHKRCTLCSYFFDTKDLRCPCCKTRL